MGNNTGMKNPVLLTGGAGYIGSHIAHLLHDAGYPVVVVDKLGNSRADLLPPGIPFYQRNVLDTAGLIKIMDAHGVTNVIHLAAYLSVEESVAQPLKYYRNNVDGTRSLLEACLETGINKLIFSSTAAAYRSSEKPLQETDALEPGSPYGHSKLMAEQLIRDTVAASPLKAVILRYFNVAGADPQGRTGQQGIQATHLISRACQAAAGDRDKMTINGTDYDTPDGTCMRDYIHVSDLAHAHRVVLEQDFIAPVKTFNCGYGSGFSVAQVVSRVKAVTGVDFPVDIAPRRAGDLAQTVADTHALLGETSWRPKYDDLDTMIKTAWEWYQRERALVKEETASAPLPVKAAAQ
ncbi:MAG: UDP-glucose 4-epimerase GalE [Alphaproteobacteria bacterium]|nr:UDP-glucose 4-epimerase GalE [Alphaproteobacteria bacterium]